MPYWYIYWEREELYHRRMVRFQIAIKWKNQWSIFPRTHWFITLLIFKNQEKIPGHYLMKLKVHHWASLRILFRFSSHPIRDFKTIRQADRQAEEVKKNTTPINRPFEKMGIGMIIRVLTVRWNHGQNGINNLFRSSSGGRVEKAKRSPKNISTESLCTLFIRCSAESLRGNRFS